MKIKFEIMCFLRVRKNYQGQITKVKTPQLCRPTYKRFHILEKGECVSYA